MQCPKWGCDIPFEIYEATPTGSLPPKGQDGAECDQRESDPKDTLSDAAFPPSLASGLLRYGSEEAHRHWEQILKEFQSQKESPFEVGIRPDPKTPDPEWLSQVGKEGWTMITGDINVSRSPLFLADLERSTARVFILSGLNGKSREEKAACIISEYPKIMGIVNENSGPILWKINSDGSSKQIDFQSHLQKMRTRRKKV